MHEFGVTETIVRRLLNQLQRDKVSKVLKISFRRSSAFSEEVLRQTFDVLSAGTLLAGAELVVEIAVLRVLCDCGRSSAVNSEDLAGHMFICPACGAVREIAEAHDLELVEVIAETEDSLDGIQA
jgi:Zn finger protein HypA/HybF involved in hydrogenase expression